MADERCPRCDKPRATEAQWLASKCAECGADWDDICECSKRVCWGDYDGTSCNGETVDWRARAIAAEQRLSDAERDRDRNETHAARAERVAEERKADLSALKLAAEALQAELDRRGREANELEAQVERARAKLVEYCTNGEPVNATLEALAAFVVGRARDGGDELQALRDLLCSECRGAYECAVEDTEGVE